MYGQRVKQLCLLQAQLSSGCRPEQVRQLWNRVRCNALGGRTQGQNRPGSGSEYIGKYLRQLRKHLCQYALGLRFALGTLLHQRKTQSA